MTDGVARKCVICSATAPAAEEARARCNIRRFREEQFSVWRCAECGSLHASDEVDLPHYYAHYPFHGSSEPDGALRVMYRSLLGRLTGVGLRPEHTVLDYGCGGGQFVRYLAERGFDAVGFDEYSEAHRDTAVLSRRYDFILSQDVIEHVEDPLALLALLESLVVPGGLVAIGTPNATGIDLGDTERCVHALHQPYHRHIFAAEALKRAGAGRGWDLVRFFPTMYNHTGVPFINPRFMVHYLRSHDDTLDLGFEKPRFSWRLLSPMTLVWGLGGYFAPMDTDVMAVFRVPAA